MFKSYASGSVISQNTRVSVNEFVPVSVTFDVNISGFPTSYSYYAANEGIEGISAKDVAKANSISNDWMGSGSASYVMTSTGIPSRLLTFESFTLNVDGKEYVSSEAGSSRKEAGTPIVVEATTGHNSWGQKDITATVTYKDVEGNEYTATKTITRHITGLPYVAAPPKDNGDNPWDSNYALWLNQITFSADNVALSATSRAPAITSPAFHIPEKLDVTVNTNHSLAYKNIAGVRKTVFKVEANNKTIISNGNECTKLAMSGNGKLSPAGNTVTCISDYTMIGPSVTIFSVAINYR